MNQLMHTFHLQSSLLLKHKAADINRACEIVGQVARCLVAMVAKPARRAHVVIALIVNLTMLTACSNDYSQANDASDNQANATSLSKEAYDVSANISAVSLRDGIDETAGALPSFIISTPYATYYLEKSGGGLSSMLDRDGIDWLGFNNTLGSGWKG